MTEALLLVGVAVIGFMGSVGTLISLFADFARHPVRKWQRVSRALSASGLLIISVAAGIGAHRARPRANTPEAAPLTQTSGTDTTVSLPATKPAPTSFPTDTSQPAAPVVARPVTPRLRITDTSGASVPQLVAAAKDLRHEYALEGVLHERSEQSPELQNLYTVHLTLNATVTQGSNVLAAFSVRSRGGGFQIEAARAQALDRLATAMQERLQEVPQQP